MRADLNVPQNKDGSIASDARIKALLPTLELLKEHAAHVLILTHWGKPNTPDQKLSTKTVAENLTNKGHKTEFAASIEKAATLIKKHKLVMLENLRFWKEEYEQHTAFAKKLAALGDYYVNDAFGALHRNHCSVTTLADCFTPENKSIGLLVEKELKALNTLRAHTKPPFVILQGGAKGSTKLALLSKLLSKANTILVSTPLCFSFLKAQNKNVGDSFVEEDLIPEIKKFLRAASKNNVTVLLPIDYQVSSHTFEDPKRVRIQQTLRDGDVGISIGPETAVRFAQALKSSKTVFMNGLPGNIHYPETIEGTRVLLQALSQTNGLHIIAGGDSLALVGSLGFTHLGHLSTGGGATLAYLSGQPLPGLASF